MSESGSQAESSASSEQQKKPYTIREGDYEFGKGRQRKYVYNGGPKRSVRLGSGGVIPKTAELGRMVHWPKYVQLQRQKKILMQRLKVPPTLEIFNRGVNKAYAHSLMRFCKNYSPESKKQRKLRLKAAAKLQAEGKPVPKEKRMTITYGAAEVMKSIEKGRAKLVAIAHDVDPIELVMWMPTLCVKKDVPFVIFKSRSRLGELCHKKMVTAIAICEVRAQDSKDLQALRKKAKMLYNNRFNEHKRSWGRQVQGIKTRHKILKMRKLRRLENEKRAKAMAMSK